MSNSRKGLFFGINIHYVRYKNEAGLAEEEGFYRILTPKKRVFSLIKSYEIFPILLILIKKIFKKIKKIIHQHVAYVALKGA